MPLGAEVVDGAWRVVESPAELGLRVLRQQEFLRERVGRAARQVAREALWVVAGVMSRAAGMVPNRLVIHVYNIIYCYSLLDTNVSDFLSQLTIPKPSQSIDELTILGTQLFLCRLAHRYIDADTRCAAFRFRLIRFWSE